MKKMFSIPQKSKRPASDKNLNFLDLFAGCGGFSLGMDRAGFHALAAIDVNWEAVETYRKNFPEVKHVLQKDLTTFKPSELELLLDGQTVDVIIGGPPCQGFSNVRKVDGTNHGKEPIEDPRRYLYRDFLRFVDHFKPSVFVIENVLGIRTAAGGEFLTRVHSEARALGYRVHGQEVRAWRYGVPQKRIRQLIIGTRENLPIFYSSRFLPATHAEPVPLQLKGRTQKKEIGSKRIELPPAVTLWEAIGDLPRLAAGQGEENSNYDLLRREHQLSRYSGRYIKKVLEVHKAKFLTGHISRPHNDRDLRDFDRLYEGESSAAAMRDRGVEFEWPYSKAHFKDRYTRQHRNGLCSTIVAHLSKDGLMFIHPTQRRSLTPREAARIQSFPDWFLFPNSRTHAFTLIGNAVPPLIGEAVGKGIRQYLESARQQKRVQLRPTPRNVSEAVQWLRPLLMAAEQGSLSSVSVPEFRKAWFAIGFIHHRLHADGVFENGITAANPANSYLVAHLN